MTPFNLQTDRLIIRNLILDDAPFIFELVNDPAWLEHIGDRQVHSLEQAREFIQSGPLASYESNHHGLYAFCDKHTQVPMGLCGLLKRDFLTYPDIGYAILPAYRGKGFTLEACQGVLQGEIPKLGLTHLHGLVSQYNQASIQLLERLGFSFSKNVVHQQNETMLFTLELDDE